MSYEDETPYPWRWHNPPPGDGEDNFDGKNWLASLLGKNGKTVCDFGDDTTYYPTPGTPPSDADKALMQAAPELRDACVFALTALVAYNASPPVGSTAWLAQKDLRAAIARSEEPMRVTATIEVDQASVATRAAFDEFLATLDDETRAVVRDNPSLIEMHQQERDKWHVTYTPEALKRAVEEKRAGTSQPAKGAQT